MKLKRILSSLFLIANTAMGASQSTSIQYVDGLLGTRSYIANGNAEKQGVKGLAAYADAAGAAPVDGTGGSPTTTCTRTTSSPLAGDGSFLITHTATNLQGEGCSINFPIDAADQGRTLQVQFDYAIASGTFVGGTDAAVGDLVIYLYDVTNGVLIQPVGYKVTGSVSGQFYHHLASFQASSNSTSFRLIWHTATTNANAWTFKFDNVKVSPQISTIAPIVTPWVSYTPSSSGTWVANSTWTGQWRRVGDSIEIQAEVLLGGAPTSTALLLNLPSGISIDTAKIPGFSASLFTPILGAAQGQHGVSLYNFQLNYNSATSLQAFFQSSVTNGFQTSINQASPVTWGSTDYVTFTTFRIPIVGWQTNAQISSDAGPSLVAGSAYRNGTQTGVNPNNSPVKIQLNSITPSTSHGYDYNGSWDVTTNNRWVCPLPGVYSFTAAIEISATNTLASNYGTLFEVNGSPSAYGQTVKPLVGTSLTVGGSTQFKLNAGDYVELYLFGSGNNSSSTLTVNGGSVSTYMEVSRVSNPTPVAQIGVQSSGQGQTNLNWANVTPTSSGACTINSQGGGIWLTAATPVAVGKCTLTVATGTCSQNLICTGSDSAPSVLTNNYSVNPSSTSSTSITLFSTLQSSGSNTVAGNADPVNISCVCPH